jgi:large subunit ribosomal protein L3
VTIAEEILLMGATKRLFYKMTKAHKPRLGSMQFWPRKRARHSVARIRSWAKSKNAKPQAFIGYKVGMTHLLVVDNRPKSITKGDKIVSPVTIIECPPLIVMGVAFYKNSLLGMKKSVSVLAENLDKALSKTIQLPKKTIKKIDEVKEFDDLRILVYSNPKQTSNGSKKPKLLEIALGGSNEEKIAFAKENLGKTIKISDIFENGNSVDVHGISKGKGFQGTVKRFGAPIRQHKSEKTKRGIGNLGAWTPKRVDFRVPQSGKMGFHLRTEHNKQIIEISNDVEKIMPAGGLRNYGNIKNDYLLLKGSVVGPKRREVVLTESIRPNKKMTKEAPVVAHIHK